MRHRSLFLSAALGACLAVEAPCATAKGAATELEQLRAANAEAYAREQAALVRDHKGEWALIAGGKLVGTGKTLDDVSERAPEAKHRFLFKVGGEGDEETQITTWYGPRFSGTALPMALGFEFRLGPGWRRGEETLPRSTAEPFPRTPVEVRAPGAKGETLDVFIGTVGPALVLTPDDFDRLGLARSEVPGTLTVKTMMGGFQVPCRRATVRVAIAGGDAQAILVAAVPTVPRAQLVDFGRWRDFDFFQGVEKGFGVWPMMPEAHLTGWVLFGCDRVLGHGDTAADALALGNAEAPEAYHRALTKMPRGGEVVYDAAAFTEVATPTLDGERVTVRRSKTHGDDVYLSDEKTADRLRLELAEDMRCVFVLEGGKRMPARAGAAWRGGRRVGVPASPDPVPLSWVVYPLPAGKSVGWCEPAPPLPPLPGGPK